jgi:hypothetical protein
MFGKFAKRLEAVCHQNRATAVHALAHHLDFFQAYQVSKKLGIKYFLSVHDDLLYSFRERPNAGRAEKCLAQAWCDADGRFVISSEMGAEYRRRYGPRPFEVVTDGVEQVPTRPLPRRSASLRVYFMGLFHRSYQPNMSRLLDALERLRASHPRTNISVRCRCGQLPESLAPRAADFGVKVLPMGSQQDIVDDIDDADLLYLPLPFEAEYDAFVRLSMSTKMITYLGSGVPVLFHGPADSATGRLLSRHDAALAVHSLDVNTVARCLERALQCTDEIVRNGLCLCRSKFLLQDQRQRFWDVIAPGNLREGDPTARSARSLAYH